MTRARDVANVLSTATALATDTETAAAISSHNSATTSVHGISNTASLATQTYADNAGSTAVSTHNTSANGHVKRGGTASRPESPSIGDLYYNTDVKDLEQYTEDGWLIVAKQPPRIPTIGTATLGSGNNVSISFTPSSYGQSASSYTVESNPGSYTASGSSSPLTIAGSNLTIGTPYTFRVKATGTYGDSAYSAYTESITPFLELGNFESIATVTVGAGDAANVEFTSIPSTYTHLQVRAIGRSAESANSFATVNMQINSDTGTNYSTHNLGGNGSSTYVDAATSANVMWAAYVWPKNSTTASTYGVLIMDILDYKDTNKYKTIRTLSGGDANGSGYINLTSGSWRSTSAITSLKFYFNTYNLVQYSHFALYGIKGE